VDGCSQRRPDLLCDFGDQVIIVEVDEGQHEKYDCSCENKRLMEISRDCSHRPIVFIRFNPDQYRVDGKLVRRPWAVNKATGLLIVSEKNLKEWNKRLDVLKSQIEYWTTNKTDKTVELIELFYDS
jgi:hypothetical protein